MDPKIKKFFEKHSISLTDILYIIREDGKTAVYLLDGRIITTYHTVKEFRESLPTDHFFYPNKGVLVAASQIVDVRGGAYTMSDGRSFKYRVHNSQLHDMRLLALGRRIEHVEHLNKDLPMSYFSVLDKMPLPVCVIEHVRSEQEVVGQFFYRYCNESLLQFENLSRDQIIGKSLGQVYPTADPGTMVAYMDVALNGTMRVVEEVNQPRGERVKIYCYQPAPDYCACIMTDRTPLPATPHAETQSKVMIL